MWLRNMSLKHSSYCNSREKEGMKSTLPLRGLSTQSSVLRLGWRPVSYQNCYEVAWRCHHMVAWWLRSGIVNRFPRPYGDVMATSPKGFRGTVTSPRPKFPLEPCGMNATSQWHLSQRTSLVLFGLSSWKSNKMHVMVCRIDLTKYILDRTTIGPIATPKVGERGYLWSCLT